MVSFLWFFCCVQKHCFKPYLVGQNSQFSHLLTVRAEGAGPPSPPIWSAFVNSFLVRCQDGLEHFLAGLSTFHSGPKVSKMVNLDVFDNLGPFWTISGKNQFVAPRDLGEMLLSKKVFYCLKWSKKGPHGPKRVLKTKTSGWSFRTLLVTLEYWQAYYFGHFEKHTHKNTFITPSLTHNALHWKINGRYCEF